MDDSARKPIPLPSPPTKDVIFEFLNGSRDGTCLLSGSTDGGEAYWVLGLYYMTLGGQKGARFLLPTDYRLAQVMKAENVNEAGKYWLTVPHELYEVVDSVEDDRTLYVRCRFVSRTTEAPRVTE